jgi:two-component system nitrate/nitrite response regulator NarL
MSQAPVFLVGGSDLFRRGLRGFLEATPFEPVGEFTRYQECVAAAGVARPPSAEDRPATTRGPAAGVARSPSAEDRPATTREPAAGNGPAPALIVYVSSGVIEETASAVDALLGAYDGARLLLLSSAMSVEELGACLRMGARGYLLNTISKDALIHSLALIALGETVFPSDLAYALMSGGDALARTAGSPKLPELTLREVDILHCLTEGMANKQIARRLGIREATVKIHVKSLIGKLGVANRTQAALWGVRAGIGGRPSSVA